MLRAGDVRVSGQQRPASRGEQVGVLAEVGADPAGVGGCPGLVDRDLYRITRQILEREVECLELTTWGDEVPTVKAGRNSMVVELVNRAGRFKNVPVPRLCGLTLMGRLERDGLGSGPSSRRSHECHSSGGRYRDRRARQPTATQHNVPPPN